MFVIITLKHSGSLVAVGFAVLVGITRIEEPYVNFRNIFEGSTSNLNSLATAFVKTNYAFAGWHNAFNVLGEVKSAADPVRVVRKAGFVSLSLVTVLSFLINVAYVAAVPRDQIPNSGQLVAALFFHRVFGDS
jgi:amino acid transporter